MRVSALTGRDHKRPDSRCAARDRPVADGGIDFHDLNQTFEEEGGRKFAKSSDWLLRVIADKRNPASIRGSRPLLDPA